MLTVDGAFLHQNSTGPWSRADVYWKTLRLTAVGAAEALARLASRVPRWHLVVVRIIDHREVQRLTKSSAAIVDALPRHEYRRCHIANAIHLPLRNVWRGASGILDRERTVITYCRDCLWDLSSRAAAQLELLGFGNVYWYQRGKADWIVRGLPSEPHPPLAERLKAFPFFINNLAPGFRNTWIKISGRAVVGASISDAPRRLGYRDLLPESLPDGIRPAAVILNEQNVLIGAIDRNDDGAGAGSADGGRAVTDLMDPGPQTIRPDMTHELAADLLRHHPYILVTESSGRYLGLYVPR
jgi:rhodanese-related sulfurtransferase